MAEREAKVNITPKTTVHMALVSKEHASHHNCRRPLQEDEEDHKHQCFK